MTGWRPTASRYGPNGKSKKNCQGDVGRRAALVSDGKNLSNELNNVFMSR
jgi:hypothetical protein